MATLTELTNGSEITNSSLDGFTATRVFLARNLSGADVNARLKEALDLPGVPRPGDPHPSVSNLYLLTVRAEPYTQESSTHARVVATYRVPSFDQAPPDQPQFGTRQISATVATVIKNVDVNGDEIILQHTFNTVDENGNPVQRTEYQPTEVEVSVPQLVVSLTRRESQPPFYQSEAYLRKVNQSGWLGKPARTWLCTKVDGSSDDGGNTYTVVYEFTYNPDTWDQRVVFIDPDTGRPPIDEDTGESTLVDGLGVKKVQIYELADFRDLNISF